MVEVNTMPENLNDKTKWGELKISIPPELVALNLGPDPQRFFDAMVFKLRRNHHKGRWEALNLDTSFTALRGEVTELDSAISHGSSTEITLEAADVANQALIVASIALEARGAR